MIFERSFWFLGRYAALSAFWMFDVEGLEGSKRFNVPLRCQDSRLKLWESSLGEDGGSELPIWGQSSIAASWERA